MFSGLLLPLLIVAFYVAFRRRGNEPQSDGNGDHAGPTSGPPGRRDLLEELEEWRSAGLITDDQVGSIVEHERSQHPLPPPLVAPEVSSTGLPAAAGPSRRVAPGVPTPNVAEAIGYLGGVLALVGMVLLVARYWTDMEIGGRLGLSGGAALVLFGAGWFVSEDRDPALRRLRWFLWLVSSAALGTFAGLLADHLVDGATDDGVDLRVPLLVAAVLAVQNGVLCAMRVRPVQQAVFLIAASVTVGTAVGQVASSAAAGVAVWVLGLVGVVIGLRRVASLPILTLAVGAASAVVGAMVVTGSSTGTALLLATSTSVSFVGLAAVRLVPTSSEERAVLAVVAGFGLFANLAPTLGYFAERSAIVTGAAVWTIGLALLVLSDRPWMRGPVLVSVIGTIAWIGGAAMTGLDLDRVGPLLGVATAVAAVWAGVLLDRFLVSVVGALGLVGTVPWSIVEWFPGEGRAPLLIMVTGVVTVVLAFLLARIHGSTTSGAGDR